MSVKEKVRERGKEGQEKGELEERGKERGKEERQRGREGKEERKKEKEGGRQEEKGRWGEEKKRGGREGGRKGEEEKGRRRGWERREVSKSTTKIAESRTGRIIREVIPRLSFISKAGLTSFSLCLNEIAN